MYRIENENYRQDFSPQGELPPMSAEVKSWFPVPEPGEVNYEARIRPERIRIPEPVIDSLKGYVRETLQEISGYSKPELDGVVIGLSGGIDSTATAALCKEALSGTRHFIRGLIMGRVPEGQRGEMNAVEYQDVMFAIQSARDMGIDYEYIDMSSLVKAVRQTFPDAKPWELSGILPRLRASLLYQAADNNNAICAGTTNGTEFILASFSVGGPAGHFQPFLDFYKSEVYKIAEVLGVPDYIINRRPGISELGIYEE